MRTAFATHGPPILEELSNRGILETPTLEALNIQQTAAERTEDETIGHTSTFQIDGETYTGYDTIVSNEEVTAIVSVVPATGKALASISPDSGEGEVIGTTDDDSVGTMHTGHCEGDAYIDACSCEYHNSPCECNNEYEYHFYQHWCCPCGDSCTHCWQVCPGWEEECTYQGVYPCDESQDYDCDLNEV